MSGKLQFVDSGRQDDKPKLVGQLISKGKIVVSSDRFQKWLLRAGLLISAVLLIRFAIDFSIEMWWLAAPFWLLLAVTLCVGVINVFAARTLEGDATSISSSKKLLLAAIPLAFFASSLDCTGLSVQGCSPFCTFIKVIWIPLIAVICVVYSLTQKPGWLTVITLMSFVALVPHCECYNVGNGWWIDRLGVSPLCYGWGFLVSMISVGALRRGALYWQSLMVSFTIISGATAFFVSHHYFQFPW